MSKSRTEARTPDWGDLDTFDPDRFPSRSAWHLARAEVAASVGASPLAEIQAAVAAKREALRGGRRG